MEGEEKYLGGGGYSVVSAAKRVEEEDLYNRPLIQRENKECGEA